MLLSSLFGFDVPFLQVVYFRAVLVSSDDLSPSTSSDFTLLLTIFWNLWIYYWYFLLTLKISENLKKELKPLQNSWEPLSRIKFPPLLHDARYHFKIENENSDLWHLIQFPSSGVYLQCAVKLLHEAVCFIVGQHSLLILFSLLR